MHCYSMLNKKTNLFVPIASNSSMKIMDGAFSLAKAKASRTSLAPSPINIWTNWGPASFRNVAYKTKGKCHNHLFLPNLLCPKATPPPPTLVCAAHALASRVFPVPGGPYMSTPLGGWMPRFSNFSLWFMGSTIASTSCKNKVICWKWRLQWKKMKAK